MIKAHIIDGVAVTKFLYWFKNKKKVCTEKIIERKLENLRKKSIFYLYPSFDTIADQDRMVQLFTIGQTIKQTEKY